MRLLRAFHRHPDFIIGRPGSPYMRRWYVIPRNRWFNIYLHNIVRSDDDRALHDHPWWNLSILLKGGYWEVTPPYRPLYPEMAIDLFHEPKLVRKWRRPGSVVLRRATDAHRLEVTGSTWSLFITGRNVRSWGFWCPQGWRHWQQFVDMTNTGAVGPGCGEA